MNSTTRVLIADEQPLFVSGVRMAIAQSDQCDFAGQADNASRCVELLEAEAPDVLLVDSNICGFGEEFATRIESVSPKTRTIILSADPRRWEVACAIKNGSAGYVPKTASADLLIEVIANIMSGKRYFATSLKRSTQSRTGAPNLRSQTAFNSLTTRERTVLGLVSEQKSNKEIALRLGIAEKTVKHHVGAILNKLGACDRVEAAILSTDWLGANA